MDELSAADRQLVEQAKQATANSYANYSHFHVGAALRLADGSIQIGANQENAAFSSGLCAERSAIFAAQAMHPEHAITALAIAACNANGFTQEPVTPCGACRQVILEMEDRYQSPVRIALRAAGGLLPGECQGSDAPVVCRQEHAHVGCPCSSPSFQTV